PAPPTIQAALNVTPDKMSWIQTAYLIAEVVAIPLTGFLTRLLSMRWLFVGAVTLFTLASLGCASSQGFGGRIAWTYSWHWLFLINLAPGVVSALGAAVLLPAARPHFAEARKLDGLS